MTLNELLQVGDEVVFKIGPERRAWTNTYDNLPDGTTGIVCGFGDAVIYEPRIPVRVYQPGVYHRRGAVSVWLADGRIVPGDWSISLVDQEEERRRDAALRGANGVLRTRQVRIGDLPETKFWEQDKVSVQFPDGRVENMTVACISYGDIHSKRADGSPWPFYDVHYMDGGSTSVEESWMELIERGNVWKFYHDEPLSFADLKEEASFFWLIGHTDEVRNPRNDLYSWTKDEVLEAIKIGLVHSFSASNGFFGSGPHISALRFRDIKLGERIAHETLQGFDMTPASESLL